MLSEIPQGITYDDDVQFMIYKLIDNKYADIVWKLYKAIKGNDKNKIFYLHCETDNAFKLAMAMIDIGKDNWAEIIVAVKFFYNNAVSITFNLYVRLEVCFVLSQFMF